VSVTVRTINDTDRRVWITIYDLGKTTHLDYGWVDAHKSRDWASGNYALGSFYYVRGEVKSDDQGSDPTVFDTTMQINPQLMADSGKVGPVAGLFPATHVAQSTVRIQQSVQGGYYWIYI
jgi:hypothetical protein